MSSPDVTRVVERLAAFLRQFPDLQSERSDHRIDVRTSNQSEINVWIAAEAEHYTVGYDGWHERFTAAEEAINCFIVGITGHYRLKVHWKGAVPYRWTLEVHTEQGWLEDSTTGLLFFPYWRRGRVTYHEHLPRNVP